MPSDKGERFWILEGSPYITFRKATSLHSSSSLEWHLHLCFSPPLPRDRGPHPMPRFVLPSKSEGFSPSTFSQHLLRPDRSSSLHSGSVASFPLCRPPGQPVTISLVSAPSLPLPWLPCLSETPEELTEGNGKMCVCVGSVCPLACLGRGGRRERGGELVTWDLSWWRVVQGQGLPSSGCVHRGRCPTPEDLLGKRTHLGTRSPLAAAEASFWNVAPWKRRWAPSGEKLRQLGSNTRGRTGRTGGREVLLLGPEGQTHPTK